MSEATIQPFERFLQQQGFQHVAGVDEAGRGAFAGPVVASAVILPFNCRIPGLTDSKKLTPKQRDDLFVQIQKTAVAIGIGCAGNEEIDRVNILQATMLAMRQAIERICPLPDFVLVDGTQLPPISIRAEAIPKGDALYQSIAAASVIATFRRRP